MSCAKGCLMVALVMVSASMAMAQKIVKFKDAAKIKSWDAWDDHLKKKGWINILPLDPYAFFLSPMSGGILETILTLFRYRRRECTLA